MLSDLPLGGIRYYESTGSTNDTAALWAEEGAPDFAIVLADAQTNGRGRLGRKWFSYPGSGLALSLILRPTTNEQREKSSLLTRFTGLGALAVSQVLQKHYALPAQIKWPNDVLIRNRKLCGVLTEAHWNGDKLSYVILGIGINVSANAIPPGGELEIAATSVASEVVGPVDRILFLHQLLLEIITWRAQLMDESFLRTWESNLVFYGELVEVVSDSRARKDSNLLAFGQIIGLDNDGALLLRTSSGEEVTLRCGEILNPGYQGHG